ncbi:peptidylprolyl isomerase [Ferroacidibacillus organovorans]|uniref:Peptidyl-prolyl cis-trans isomerase n=1 Tax=Ferroacidibacillus organovorans TaxID=1765683 RepID=A0A161PXM1_9BACL|nr:peptidylprolyl isomerase [Ferroacidibacillus organovorans]KYP80605.1 peptidylprolyl isomerase [Ferroacidibacillus organovorans]OAG92891.1 peptidylprolyl isomerase [Ferroacidibacillus organovorans]OPG15842.1 peptidylprolyl isomerase [Ferroacidibacillus organovorans]
MKKAIVELANGGTMEFELFEKEAPGTVANFEKLANSGFYDGLSFHRVIPGFVAQGGCPNGTGTGGPGYTIKCEVAGNPHIHQRGALSMAHAGRDTGGSQFFIVHDRKSTAHLDGNHTVFGQVSTGDQHIEAIQQGDRMTSIRVVELPSA